MRKAQIFGIVLVVLVIAVSILFKSGWLADRFSSASADTASGGGTGADPVVLKGMIGSEKEALFNDEEFQRIAKDKYGLILDTFKAGSLEMTDPQTLKDYDFIFPASQTVVEQLKNTVKIGGAEEVFRTPLVYYSWDRIVQSLTQKGIVQEQADGSLMLDNKRLIDLIGRNVKWSDIGLADLYGPIVVDTSDPQKSNSGNSYAAIVAEALSDEGTVTRETIPAVKEALQKIFTKSGFKKSSTTELFEEYLKTGIGSHKLIVGYESDMLYFSKQNPQIWEQLKQSAKPRMLYPSPTLWSVHTIVPLNDKAKAMIGFLQDPDVQKLAWERYGFRTGVVGNAADTDAFSVAGLSNSIDRVMQLPDYATMEALLKAFDGQ